MLNTSVGILVCHGSACSGHCLCSVLVAADDNLVVSTGHANAERCIHQRALRARGPLRLETEYFRSSSSAEPTLLLIVLTVEYRYPVIQIYGYSGIEAYAYMNVGCACTFVACRS